MQCDRIVSTITVNRTVSASIAKSENHIKDAVMFWH